MVAVVGFAMIICIVALLLKGKMSPIVVLTVIPAVAALILGHGPVEIADFIKEASATCGTVYYNGGWQFIGFFEQCRREDAESFADYMHRLVHAYNEESGDAKMEYSLGMAESRTANAHTLRTLLRGAMMDRRKQED